MLVFIFYIIIIINIKYFTITISKEILIKTTIVLKQEIKRELWIRFGSESGVKDGDNLC